MTTTATIPPAHRKTTKTNLPPHMIARVIAFHVKNRDRERARGEKGNEQSTKCCLFCFLRAHSISDQSFCAKNLVDRLDQ